MDFSNERYVRYYIRETTTWKLLPWEAQALLPQVLRLVDRAGVLECGGASCCEAVSASLPKWPVEVVKVGLEALLAKGVLEFNEETASIIWPRFLEAQESRQSDRQRASESRARRRDAARKRNYEDGRYESPIIYFIAAADGAIKIGITRDLNARLKDLQQSHPLRLRLIGSLYGDEAKEEELHETFASCRIRGEWFSPNQQLVDFLTKSFGPSHGVTPCHTSLHEVTPRLTTPSLSTPNHSAEPTPQNGTEKTSGNGKVVEFRNRLTREEARDIWNEVVEQVEGPASERMYRSNPSRLGKKEAFRLDMLLKEYSADQFRQAARAILVDDWWAKRQVGFLTLSGAGNMERMLAKGGTAPEAASVPYLPLARQ